MTPAVHHRSPRRRVGFVSGITADECGVSSRLGLVQRRDEARPTRASGIRERVGGCSKLRSGSDDAEHRGEHSHAEHGNEKSVWIDQKLSRIITTGEDRDSRNARPARKSSPVDLFQRGPGANAMAFGSDGSRLVCGCADGAIRVWKVALGSVLGVLRAHDNSVVRIAHGVSHPTGSAR